MLLLRGAPAIGLVARRAGWTGATAAAARFVSATASFRVADLEVVEKQPRAPPQLPEDLAFGRVFTDHMLLANHSAASGWGRPRIVPFGPLELHPAAQVLHYGMGCFEGMKAYAGADGRMRLFRPDLNMARLLRSARRLLLAEFDPQELQACIAALLRLDRAWMPHRPGHSMYIRPFLYGCDGALGVHTSSRTTLCAIMSPVGPYFKSGSAAVRLFLDTENVRAWPGGAGQFKIGGNYAPTVLPQREALTKHKCSQVMYALPQGPDPAAATISECGAMNLHFVFARRGRQQQQQQLEVVTPPLDGTILPGVTRDSILQLLRACPDVAVSERPLTVGELLAAHAAGELLEVFGSGTACVVQPVGCIVTAEGRELSLPAGQPEEEQARDGSGGWGPDGAPSVAEWARRLLTDIQHGRADPHPWSVAID